MGNKVRTIPSLPVRFESRRSRASKYARARARTLTQSYIVCVASVDAGKCKSAHETAGQSV